MDIERTVLAVTLILSVITLVIVLRKIRARRLQTVRLERDSTGLWRYHRESQFQKKIAYAGRINSAKDSAHGKAKESLKPAAVIHFGGDIRAKQHRTLANLVDEIEINREALSEVVIVLTSPGGLVSQYGHAFSQIERVRRLGVPLTVCIDVVAASGGYLMSLPADRIVAAPFAVVGSVGVVAFVPNLRPMLQQWGIQPRTFTAGRYKRTVTLTDDASPEEVARFKHQLEAIHRLFLDAVRRYRPGAKMEEVETGGHWTAAESIDLALGLVDEIGTSHEYLLRLNRDRDLILISQKKTFWEDGIGLFGSSLADGLLSRLREVLPVARV